MNGEWWRGAAGVAAALSIAACGVGGSKSSAAAIPAPSPSPSPGGGAAPGPTRCDDVTIRIAGTQPELVTAFSLVLGAATASAVPDGATLVVAGAPVGTSLELFPDAVQTLGQFHLPDGEDAFSVSLSFTDGAVARGGAVSPLGPCTSPLSFRSERARLSPERCQVLVLLDVGRSAVPDGSGVAFIPQFRVVY